MTQGLHLKTPETTKELNLNHAKDIISKVGRYGIVSNGGIKP